MNTRTNPAPVGMLSYPAAMSTEEYSIGVSTLMRIIHERDDPEEFCKERPFWMWKHSDLVVMLASCDPGDLTAGVVRIEAVKQSGGRRVRIADSYDIPFQDAMRAVLLHRENKVPRNVRRAVKERRPGTSIVTCAAIDTWDSYQNRLAEGFFKEQA